MRSLCVVVKLSQTCNLKCTYCYMSPFLSKGIMDDTMIFSVISKCLDYADSVEFIWHGGEPLLAGISKFEYIRQIQDRLNIHNKKILNLIQSNGTLLTEAKLRRLKSLGYGVGVSIDGDESVQNRLRPFHNGKPSYPKVLQGIRNVLEVYGAVGICCVITKGNVSDAKSTYESIRDSGARAINLIPNFNYASKCELSITSDEYMNFLIEFASIYFPDKHETFHTVSPITHYLFRLLGARSECCLCNPRCLESIISVTIDGNIYLCDLPDSQALIGNLSSISKLSDLFDSPEYQKKVNTVARNVFANCTNCEMFNVCGGGCRSLAFASSGDYSGRDPFCEARRGIIRFLYGEINKYNVFNSTNKN